MSKSSQTCAFFTIFAQFWPDFDTNKIFFKQEKNNLDLIFCYLLQIENRRTFKQEKTFFHKSRSKLLTFGVNTPQKYPLGVTNQHEMLFSYNFRTCTYSILKYKRFDNHPNFDPLNAKQYEGTSLSREVIFCVPVSNNDGSEYLSY